jgi:radical SAM superfamily enzyme YgiQ (UPF0313 family)
MSSLRVALINPPVIAVNEDWYDLPNWGRVGLAYLAAYLRQHPGYEIQIIDAKFERLDFQEVLERVRDFDPHITGLTAFTNEIKPAAYQAAIVKEALPSTVTVVGGVHASALPEQTLREFPSFDFVVVGEGEVTFHEFCEGLRTGEDVRGVPGLAYREGDGVVVGPARERILDQDSIPFPAWDLLPRSDEYWVQSMRGCPFKCQFCMNPNGRVARKRSVENVVEELQMLVDRFGAKTIWFGDELFSVDMQRTHALMDAMIERGLHRVLKFDAQTHVRFVDEPLLRKMKDAGCSLVKMGVETGDEATLRRMGKGTTREHILKAGRAARASGVRWGVFLILGHPNETLESIHNSIDLAIQLNPDVPMFGIMVPYPGTEISRMAARGEGGYKLLTTDWDEYNKQIGGAMVFAGLTRSQIERLQLGAYAKVFLYNGRVRDFLKLVWQYRLGAWQVLKKAIMGGSAVKHSPLRPADYDRRLDGGAGGATLEDIVRARENWDDMQKWEMQQIRKADHSLLRVITV